jgi:hypothetical protein
LITVVVLSAVVPTVIAERRFLPDRDEGEQRDEERPGVPVPAEEFV